VTPPRIPRTLVRWLAAREDRAVIVGDLDEEFAARARTSATGARGWYWTQALASIPSTLRLRWRRAALLAGLGGDIRRSLRLLRRHPGFAAAAIVTMALGAGITTGVVSVVEAVLFRPLPYGNGNRVYALQESDPGRRGSSVSWSDFVDLSGRLHAFSAIAGYSGGSRTLTGVGAAERLPAIEVTPAFFDVLGVAPAIGRSFAASDAISGAPAVVVLSDAAWTRRFGADPAAIGRTIAVSGVPTTIVGVLPKGFLFPPRADPSCGCRCGHHRRSRAVRICTSWTSSSRAAPMYPLRLRRTICGPPHVRGTTAATPGTPRRRWWACRCATTWWRASARRCWCCSARRYSCSSPRRPTCPA